MRKDDLYSIPDSLPEPEDDGACDHLTGMVVPPTSLAATTGSVIDLSQVKSKWTVVYCFPRTGRLDREPVGGMDAWNAIPGARGCTPQSCSYRDYFTELVRLEATIYGLSAQDTEYQQEAATRLHLPFPLLSDEALHFTRALRLPTFSFAGVELIRRLTLVIHDGKIAKVFYPVFPPDTDAEVVLNWLRSAAA